MYSTLVDIVPGSAEGQGAGGGRRATFGERTTEPSEPRSLVRAKSTNCSKPVFSKFGHLEDLSVWFTPACNNIHTHK